MNENTMTLAQVRDALRIGMGSDFTFKEMADAIDAHLSRPVSVSDEDVVRACVAYRKIAALDQVDIGFVRDSELYAVMRSAMRAALEADRAGREEVGAAKSAEDRFEQYVGTLIDHSADIQRLGEWLSNRLDEDDFNTVEPMILGIAEKLAQGNGVVPDGWKLVPIEPTDAMVDAGGEIEVPSNAYHHSDIAISQRSADVYKAMLSAAPHHPTTEKTDEAR